MRIRKTTWILLGLLLIVAVGWKVWPMLKSTELPIFATKPTPSATRVQAYVLPSSTPTQRPVVATATPVSQPQPTAAQLPAKATDTPKPGQPTAVPAKLKKVQFGLVVFAPYASAIGATQFSQDWGVEIEVVNLTGLEQYQCSWVKGEQITETKDGKTEVLFEADPNTSRILLTTHNSARMCAGVKIPLAVGMSAGTDAIVAKPEIKSWNDVLLQPIAGTGYCSVSEYFIKTLAWSLGYDRVAGWIPADDAEPALDQWTTDPKIKSVVLWQPYVDLALEKVRGAWVPLSSASWAGIWDVAIIKDANQIDQGILGAIGAYLQFLKLQSEDFDKAWQVLTDWATKHPENGALGYDKSEDFKADLAGEAQATLQDNIILFLVDTSVLETRLNEAGDVLTALPCLGDDNKSIPVPQVASASLLDKRYVEVLRNDKRLQTTAKPLNPDIKLAVNIPLSEAAGQVGERIIASLPDTYIEFAPDSTDFVNQRQAMDVLQKIYQPVLRLTSNTVLELVGGYALPGGDTNRASGIALAQRRAEKIQNLLVQVLGIAKDRVRLKRDAQGNVVVREPQHPGTFDTSKQRTDRRVEGKLIVRGQ